MAISALNHDRPSSVRGNRVAGEEAVSGIVHVIREDAELVRFREGEILVAADIPDEWNHLFALAKGIITQAEKMPAQVSAAAQAFSFPVTTGVQDVTSHLRSGDIVKMCIDGTIQRMVENRAPDSRMRVSVPAAVHARQFASPESLTGGASVTAFTIMDQANDGESELLLKNGDIPRKSAS